MHIHHQSHLYQIPNPTVEQTSIDHFYFYFYFISEGVLSLWETNSFGPGRQVNPLSRQGCSAILNPQPSKINRGPKQTEVLFILSVSSWDPVVRVHG